MNVKTGIIRKIPCGPRNLDRDQSLLGNEANVFDHFGDRETAPVVEKKLRFILNPSE